MLGDILKKTKVHAIKRKIEMNSLKLRMALSACLILASCKPEPKWSVGDCMFDSPNLGSIISYSKIVGRDANSYSYKGCDIGLMNTNGITFEQCLGQPVSIAIPVYDSSESLKPISCSEIK